MDAIKKYTQITQCKQTDEIRICASLNWDKK